jgi:prevent-host-death family protein
MQCMSARSAKNSFGKLIDMARAEPVAIEKHGRAVVVVLSIERYEQLQVDQADASPRTKGEDTEQSAGVRVRREGGPKKPKVRSPRRQCLAIGSGPRFR